MPPVPPHIARLTPYTAGKPISELRRETGLDAIIKLASNENPFGPSPKAIAALQAAATDLHRYPDGGRPLAEALARHHGVSPDNILISNGSDSLIMAIARAYVTATGEVISSEGSFVQYELMPRAQGAQVTLVPMRNYHYDLDGILSKITARTQVVFLANPNNPTGTMFTRSEWESFHTQLPSHVLVVQDEAYAEFVEADTGWPNSLSYRHDNVITLRTFSKAHGLAGLRLGYAVGHASIIKELSKLRLPFEPSTLAVAAGLAALGDQEFVRKTIDTVNEGRAYVSNRLAEMGAYYVPSVANFVMIVLASAEKSKQVFEGLLKQGIIVRPIPTIPGALRISIGLPEENARCMDRLAELIK